MRKYLLAAALPLLSGCGAFFHAGPPALEVTYQSRHYTFSSGEVILSRERQKTDTTLYTYRVSAANRQAVMYLSFQTDSLAPLNVFGYPYGSFTFTDLHDRIAGELCPSLPMYFKITGESPDSVQAKISGDICYPAAPESSHAQAFIATLTCAKTW